MSDLIDRQAAINAIAEIVTSMSVCVSVDECHGMKRMQGMAVRALDDLPSAEPKKGKWLEKHHAYADEEKVIEEWQSCKCSICGRYDTRPYLYYFSEPLFCSWCGARMEGKE